MNWWWWAPDSFQKAQTIGRDNPEFCAKWCEILNKASLDLTFPVFEYTQKEIEKVNSQIAQTKANIIESHGAPLFDERVLTLKPTLESYRAHFQDAYI